VATRATAEKEVADAAIVKMSTDDMTAVKKATDDATVVKKAAEEAAAKKKAAEKAAAKKATEEAATKKKAAGDAATLGSGPSLAPSVGVKRVAALSGSTPPAKRRFLGSWKLWYITQCFIRHFLYHICDFNLVFPAYNVPSSGRSPPSRGQCCRCSPSHRAPGHHRIPTE
jgi:hypothetical protein